MASRIAKTVSKQVKPILSVDITEARKRVLGLYKAWYRQLPFIIKEHNLPITLTQAQNKLREKFTHHKDVKDIRVIDMLVIKGQMELVEMLKMWQNKGHVMNHFQQTVEKKPTDFLSKFIAGVD